MIFNQTAEQQDLLLMMENRPVAQKEKEKQISTTLENLKESMKSLTSKQIMEAERYGYPYVNPRDWLRKNLTHRPRRKAILKITDKSNWTGPIQK